MTGAVQEDKRIRRTKKLLRQALTRLMQQKDFQSITVTDVVREADIKAWRDYNNLHFIQCACRFTERCATCGGEKGSKRDEMKELIAELRKRCDTIDMNIFNSVHNINLKTVIGYHKGDRTYNFLDDYDEEEKKMPR